MINSTISGNQGGFNGGGIEKFNGPSNGNNTLTLFNTIVAGNTDSYGVAPDIGGPVTGDSAYNLIGDGTGMTGISNGDANHNQVGTSSNPINPLLAHCKTMAGRRLPWPCCRAARRWRRRDRYGVTSDQRGHLPPPTTRIGATRPRLPRLRW